MSHARLGRLPPLYALGRAESVDQEEPPDLGDDSEIDNLIEEYENFDRRYFYLPEHALPTAEAFSECYKVLQPGNHVCKSYKNEEEGGGLISGFIHCGKSVHFGQKYRELRKQLEIKAKLEFIKDYATRLQQISAFVNSVKILVNQEQQTWTAICKSDLQSPPNTQLETLQALCEETHVHMNHWNSIKQTVLMDKYLRPILPFITTELFDIRNKFHYLRNSLLWWIEQLILIGLRVLPHCDPSHLSHEVLWAVARGIENFNSIVILVKRENELQHNSKTDSLHSSLALALNIPFISAAHNNLNLSFIEGIKTISFSKVLNILAQERSKYAAVMTHNFYTASSDFLYLLKNKQLPSYNWAECKNMRMKRPSSALDSSDYYTQSGSNISLGSALLRIGTVIAPDLSQQDAAVAEFASREQEFAIKFLQIVNRSTKLLNMTKDNSLSGSPSTDAKSKVATKSKVGFTAAAGEEALSAASRKSRSATVRVLVAQTALTSQDEDTLSLCSLSSFSASNRKTVSWGDFSESGIIKHLCDRYMKMLWQHYEQEMLIFFHDGVYGGISEGRTQLGNVALCDDMTVAVISSMINQTLLKDIFPSGAVPPLYNLSRKLLVTAAWRAWDKEFCCALGVHISDNCSGTPLANGEYSSKTAHRLREAYQPLHAAIYVLQTKSEMTECEKCACYELLVATLQRVVLSSELALKWCSDKSHEFLMRWNAASFLLITQSDLKLLSDEIYNAICSCQQMCTSSKHKTSPGALIVKSTHSDTLAKLYQKINDISSHLQTLSGSSMKKFTSICKEQSEEFFQEQMPTGKMWRRKASSGLPTQRSEYIEHALLTLLEPVVTGSSKLSTPSQMSVVAMATTAMCNAWAQNILNAKIKFSYIGACQLELDFVYVKDWLSSYLSINEPVQQSVLCLDVFKYMAQAIHLLLQQPHPNSLKPSLTNSRANVSYSKSQSGVETIEIENQSSVQPTEVTMASNVDLTESFSRKVTHKHQSHGASSRSAEDYISASSQSLQRISDSHRDPSPSSQRLKSVSQVLASTSAKGDRKFSQTADIYQHNEGFYQMHNKGQWLALRVHGGSRNWPKLPNCFPST